MFARFRTFVPTFFFPAFFSFLFASYGSAQVRLIQPPSLRTHVHRNLTPNTSGNGSPQPLAPSPAFGSGYSQTFTFTFTDQNGWQNLGVLDVLVNNTLNAQNACYFALVPTSASAGFVYLVDDTGESLTNMSVPGSGSVNNSQCSLNATGASVTANANTLTLVLPITFNSTFSGSRAIYQAAQDTGLNDSGWQTMATWAVPSAPVSGPSVSGMTPERNTLGVKTTYSFTLTDSNGWQNLSVIDFLINDVVDGRGACYFALAVSTVSEGTIYLVGDGTTGSPLYAAITSLPSSSSINNSQCTLNLEGASVEAGGDTLILNMPITFSSTFTGNKLIFVNASETSASSGWQPIGSLSLP